MDRMDLVHRHGLMLHYARRVPLQLLFSLEELANRDERQIIGEALGQVIKAVESGGGFFTPIFPDPLFPPSGAFMARLNCIESPSNKKEANKFLRVSATCSQDELLEAVLTALEAAHPDNHKVGGAEAMLEAGKRRPACFAAWRILKEPTPPSFNNGGRYNLIAGQLLWLLSKSLRPMVDGAVFVDTPGTPQKQQE